MQLTNAPTGRIFRATHGGGRHHGAGYDADARRRGSRGRQTRRIERRQVRPRRLRRRIPPHAPRRSRSKHRHLPAQGCPGPNAGSCQGVARFVHPARPGVRASAAREHGAVLGQCGRWRCDERRGPRGKDTRHRRREGPGPSQQQGAAKKLPRYELFPPASSPAKHATDPSIHHLAHSIYSTSSSRTRAWCGTA